MPLLEWRMDVAKGMGILGGWEFRAFAGFGRNGRLHVETFYELAGVLAVKVEFILYDKLGEEMLQRVLAQYLNIFHVRYKVESGIV